MSVLTYNVWFDLDDWQPRFDAVAGIIEHLQPTVHLTHPTPRRSLAHISVCGGACAVVRVRWCVCGGACACTCAVVRVRVFVCACACVRAFAIAGGVPSGGDPAVRTGSEAASVAQPKLPHARRRRATAYPPLLPRAFICRRRSSHSFGFRMRRS